MDKSNTFFQDEYNFKTQVSTIAKAASDTQAWLEEDAR